MFEHGCLALEGESRAALNVQRTTQTQTQTQTQRGQDGLSASHKHHSHCSLPCANYFPINLSHKIVPTEAHLEVHVLASRHILEVHFQNFLTPLDIRVGDCDVTVKAAWPDEGLVQRLGEVGGSYTDHTITRLESAVHMEKSSWSKVCFRDHVHRQQH